MAGGGWKERQSCRLGVLVASVLLAGACSISPGSSSPGTSAGSPATAATPAASSAPTALILPAAALATIPQPIVCPALGAKPATSAPVSGSWPSGQLLEQIGPAWQKEFAELINAVGNPDTGSDSEDGASFKASLSSGDAASIRSSTEAVLAHLRAACAAVAPYFDKSGAEAWAAETRALLDGMAGEIVAIRDAAIAGNQLDAGWARFQNVLLDHFWQSIKGNTAEANRTTWPDGRSATASRIRWSNSTGNAFDGSATTFWLAGGARAPQWIEIDLGWQATITGIRLLTYQDAAGDTDHVVTFGASSGTEHQLARFTGKTSDRQWLEFTAPAPVAGVRIVRVTTLATPSTVGWREIELNVVQGSSPAPCPASGSPLSGVTALMGEPSTAQNGPALAVDGNEATGWDPGETRGPGNVRGWLRLELPKRAQISGIRVLLGPGPVTAVYEVTWWTADGRSLAPTRLAPVPAEGGWATAPGPTPCVEVRMVNIGVESASPAALIREIQVLGTIGS